MKARTQYILKYFLFWIVIFLLQKLMFMIFNFQESKILSAGDWLRVLWHGMRLDMSAAAYLLVIPVLAMSFLSFFDLRVTRNFLRIYNYIFLFAVLYLGVVDMELYSWWGIKLDITPLVYLKTPKEAAASLKLLEIALLVLFFVFLYFLGLKAYRKLIFSSLKKNSGSSWQFGIAGLLITGLLIIPMRGGIGIAPVNPGSAYFSTNRFANHSAFNVLWNCVYSIVERKSYTTSHHYMDDTKARELFKFFYPADSTHIQFVKKDANVVLIILESFSNKIIGELGGESGITPEIDKICKNSLVFRNFFASGDRSEKGMLSLFSGYPSQPTTSIINFPSKTQNLPYLKAPFHDKGYYTAFYYGGDLNFANFRSYFTNPSEDRLITLNDFPSKYATEKWGVPDERLFERMITDIDTITKPFFISCFTLSSHEPYDTPMENPVFPTIGRSDLSKNAFYYTDRCLGAFIDKAKTSKWWDNTLIIILADHGSRYPGNTQNHETIKFNIPMIWTGGALINPDTSINTYASQTDLARTLLNQYDLPVNDYPFSKDILGANSKSFAMYFFNNGFGFMSDSLKLIYDNTAKDFIYSSGKTNDESKESSKAYLQVLSNDFNSR
jgi:phosphoglycerol transferase MdoB-like AlkP superfamily enzyme